MTASLTAIARHLSFVRETEGPNRGNWVSWLQRLFGGHEGDSWCSYAGSLVCDIAYHGKPPIHQSGSSHTRMTEAQVKGYVVAEPQSDDLYFFVDANGHAHHEGVVTGISPLTGIAGNTSENGLSANGTGWFEHALNVNPKRIVFVRLPRA